MEGLLEEEREFSRRESLSLLLFRVELRDEEEFLVDGGRVELSDGREKFGKVQLVVVVQIEGVEEVLEMDLLVRRQRSLFCSLVEEEELA